MASDQPQYVEISPKNIVHSISNAFFIPGQEFLTSGAHGNVLKFIYNVREEIPCVVKLPFEKTDQPAAGLKERTKYKIIRIEDPDGMHDVYAIREMA